MDKTSCVTNLHNGIADYYLNFTHYLGRDELPEDDKLNRERVINALIAMVSLDIIYNKEKMVEKKEALNYESKMSDEALEELLALFNLHNDKELFNDGATLFAFVRNKIAHGDFSIDIDKNRLILQKDGKDAFIDVDIFINHYISITSTLNVRLKNKEFNKSLLWNKSKTLDKPVTTDKELEQLLSLMRVKKYSFRRKDGKELSTEEKTMFTGYINFLKTSTKDEKEYKDYENKLKQFLNNEKYAFDVTKHRIRDKKQIEKIKKSILLCNDIAERNNYNMDILSFIYGEEIYKIIDTEYNHTGIEMGIKLNEHILKEMHDRHIYDLDTIFKYIDISDKSSELVAAIDLARFYASYCYPLENTFNKDHNYHYDREDELEFDLLDMSEFNPTVLNIAEPGKEEAYAELKRLGKEIKKITDFSSDREKNIEGLSKKEDLTEFQIMKLDSLKQDVRIAENCLPRLYNKYLDQQTYTEMIEEDYEINYTYFRNRTIIEGMRNAIAHGNVTLENIGYEEGISQVELKFTDIYEGKTEFELPITIYSLESLFEADSIIVADRFIKKKQKQLGIKNENIERK